MIEWNGSTRGFVCYFGLTDFLAYVGFFRWFWVYCVGNFCEIGRELKKKKNNFCVNFWSSLRVVGGCFVNMVSAVCSVFGV